MPHVIMIERKMIGYESALDYTFYYNGNRLVVNGYEEEKGAMCIAREHFGLTEYDVYFIKSVQRL